MLAVVTTDYPLEPGEAIEFLRPAVDESFNAISVDGDCSTNDAVVLLANGASRRRRRDDDAFAGGAHAGLPRPRRARSSPTAKARRWSPRSASPAPSSDAEAKAIAQRIATSPLVKTALFGHDANWGRVLMAAGSAPFNGGYAHLDPALRLALTTTAPRCSSPARRRTSSRPVDGAVCTIDLDLGLGDGSAGYLTSDLSYDYVRINADYRS